jgi:hypothetical protein
MVSDIFKIIVGVNNIYNNNNNNNNDNKNKNSNSNTGRNNGNGLHKSVGVARHDKKGCVARHPVV